MPGIIALDIDGTLINAHQSLEPEMITFFKKADQLGWQLIFVTGRTGAFAASALAPLDLTSPLIVQNGAALIQWPTLCPLHTIALKDRVIQEVVAHLCQAQVPFVIELGVEYQDLCYYNDDFASMEDKNYFTYRMSISPEPWERLNFKRPLKLATVIKYFSSLEKCHEVAQRLKNSLSQPVNALVINDPFRPGHALAHITSSKASKGGMLAYYLAHSKQALYPLIAAGDDVNDLDMLRLADQSIVVGFSQSLQKIADIQVVGAGTQGLLQALKETTQISE